MSPVILPLSLQSFDQVSFHGAGMAWAGEQLDSLIWRTFLNRSEHVDGTPWPIDAVSYHDYAMGSARSWDDWARTLVPTPANSNQPCCFLIQQRDAFTGAGRKCQRTHSTKHRCC